MFFDRLSQAFTAYRISGGMPAAAMKMIEKDLNGVETTLRNILQDYSLDFVKHATPLLANRISHVWRSLPSQLAKENRKFVYQLVRPGARAREYEDALTWLQNAGLIYKVGLCSTPQVPLKSYEDLSIFKIYSLDVGLLRVLAEEVEFIVQRGLDVIPMEVKSGTSVTGRSLIEYNRKYSPRLRIRYSMLNLKQDDTFINIPLFLADRTEQLVGYVR